MFQHSTLNQLVTYIALRTNVDITIASRKKSPAIDLPNIRVADDIAVVGMACRLPEVSDTKAYWQMLSKKSSTIRDISDAELIKNRVSEKLMSNSNYVKRGSILEDAFKFDEELNTNDKYYLIQHENMDSRPELGLFAEWVKDAFVA